MIERNGLVGLVALALASSGSLACGGDDVASSISGVIPGEVFVGRSAEVLIVGNNTSWSEGVSVSFGEGVTIGDTTVASPTALMVSVTADETATLGTRDVVVTQDGEELAFAGAFELSSPVKIASVQGQIAQGSISVIKVQNLDFANPFDTTTTGDGLFTPIEYVNVQVHAGNADALIQYVEPYTMEILLLTDVTATAGAVDLEVLSGPVGQEQSFKLPGAFEVAAREPIALGAGEPVNGTIDEPYQTLVYAVTPSELSIVTAYTFADSQIASPAFALLPASGSFAELQGFGPVARFVSDEPHYLVYWDNTGATGYSFQIGADHNVVKSALTQSEPNDGIPDAQEAAELPAVLQGATLSDLDDQDWIRITVTEADVGKAVHVFTFGDPTCDTVVDVTRGNGESLGQPSSDQNYHEDFVSEVIDEPGDYYVKIYASDAGFFDPGAPNYTAAIELVDP